MSRVFLSVEGGGAFFEGGRWRVEGGGWRVECGVSENRWRGFDFKMPPGKCVI